MDPLRFAVAVIPLAMYLALIGAINLRRRPFVTTGARDMAALGIGLSGLVAVGPMELFFPEGAAVRFGAFVWLLMITFYGLCVSLIVLLLRPRIVVYNSNVDRLRPAITELANKMDQKSRWTGDSMIIPNRKIHFFMESVEWMCNVQLVAAGMKQSYDGWREFELSLKKNLSSYRTSSNPIGAVLVMVAGLMICGSLVWLQLRREEVAILFREMMRISY
jgi:hypothetical protein